MNFLKIQDCIHLLTLIITLLSSDNLQIKSSIQEYYRWTKLWKSSSYYLQLQFVNFVTERLPSYNTSFFIKTGAITANSLTLPRELIFLVAVSSLRRIMRRIGRSLTR